MPQVDKVTFFPIVVWTFILYVGGYLFMSTTYLYGFFSQLKLNAKRSAYVHGLARLKQRLSGALMFFSWVSL